MILGYILLVSAQLCTSGITYIFEINVHLDHQAMVRINNSLEKVLYGAAKPSVAVPVLFGAIFDVMNKDLSQFGVQVQGRFNNIDTRVYKPDYYHRYCDGNVAIIRSTELYELIKKKMGSYDIGNHIVVSYCKNKKNSSSTSFLTTTNCSQVGSIIYGELRSLIREIKSIAYQMIGASNTLYTSSGSSTEFVNNMCGNAIRCLSGGTKAGKRTFGEEKVVHNPTEVKYIYRKRPVYSQDMMIGDRQPPRNRFAKNLHATEDHSNDSELYEDTLR